jgi:hypothetical protein
MRNRIVEERLATPLVDFPVLVWDAAHGALAPEYLLRSHIYFKLASSYRAEICRHDRLLVFLVPVGQAGACAGRNGP